jgi:hypothetical protein
MSGDFDRLVDRVVRELLDVEPPADLRARVEARIGTRRSPLRWLWIAAPLAAAAIVIIAILLPGATEVKTPVGPGDVNLPREMAAATPVTRERSKPTLAPRAPRTVRAAVVNEPVPDDVETVPPLAGPQPLAVTTIGSGRSTPLNVMQVAPIQVEPLEVEALADTPRERHEE